ncbi:hypothetical protein JOF41_001598 [Saccharothrix coeruleofusca]|uniref:DUF3152 domain-containing protein n=1 Tax=Saccharothrix coeruleofusca TaxID=33919 RepID=UPI0027DB529A|nr:DUF3152 domain-containing protein [Saccharothrix coeruleofusca]MBP2335420.1 hypothetical protein [Saccharothrix coeruleofusca]
MSGPDWPAGFSGELPARPAGGGRRVPRLPVLFAVCVVLTAVVVLEVRDRPPPAPTPAGPAPQAAAAGPAHPAGGTGPELPAGVPFPERGHGTWHRAPGPHGTWGAGPVRTFAVEVEDGVDLPHGDDSFAAVVHRVLLHPRGWASTGRVALRSAETGEPDLRIRLASQWTARSVCGFDLPYDTSCHVDGGVYLSAARWFRGAHSFGDDLSGYRAYAVNHEVGHYLGLGHEVCPEDGAPAPLMMQQTFSTGNDELADITAALPQGVVVPRDGRVCTPNSWPG